MLELIRGVSGGLAVRHVVVVPAGKQQDVWEETTAQVKSVSYYRADVELTVTRGTRTSAGAVVGSRAGGTPSRFSIER